MSNGTYTSAPASARPEAVDLLMHGEQIATILTTQEAADALMAMLTTIPDRAPL